MTPGTLVLLGNVRFEAASLDGLCLEFGWLIEGAIDLDHLRELSVGRNSIAILFDANSLGLSWQEALASIREVDSQAFLIPCHRFSDVVTWRELADAGAFHTLALPLDVGEVRQSLGFIWSARSRRAAKHLPIHLVEAPEAVADSPRAGRHKKPATTVA